MISTLGGIFDLNHFDQSSRANDVIVIRHRDGTLHSTPFSVRFGRARLWNSADKVVQVEVNGVLTGAVMKIGHGGEACWLHPTYASRSADAHKAKPVVTSTQTTTGATATQVAPAALVSSNDDEGGGHADTVAAVASSDATVTGDAPAAAATTNATAHAGSGSAAGKQADVLTRQALAAAAKAEQRLQKLHVTDGLFAWDSAAAASPTIAQPQQTQGNEATPSSAAATAAAATAAAATTADAHTPRAATHDDVGDDVEQRSVGGGSNSSSGSSGDGDVDDDDAYDLHPLHSHTNSDGVADMYRRGEHDDDDVRRGRADGASSSTSSLSRVSSFASSVTSGVSLHASPAEAAGELAAHDAIAAHDNTDAAAAHGDEGDANADDDDAAAAAAAIHNNNNSNNNNNNKSDAKKSDTATRAHGGGSHHAYFTRSHVPTDEDLRKLHLRDGCNEVRYLAHKFDGAATCVSVRCNVFLYDHTSRLVVSDVDGTITKSDLWGHVYAMLGKGGDWTHPGICALYSNIANNGYHMIYLTARSMTQIDQTKRYLWSLTQDKDARLPRGPVLTAPSRIFTAISNEVSRQSHVFKIACLTAVRDAYPRGAKPFFAGFGNRYNDVVSYTAVGIPTHKIFLIDPTSVLHVCRVRHTYRNLAHLVDVTFPPLRHSGKREYACATNTTATTATATTTKTTSDTVQQPQRQQQRSHSSSSSASSNSGSGSGSGSSSSDDEDDEAADAAAGATLTASMHTAAFSLSSSALVPPLPCHHAAAMTASPRLTSLRPSTAQPQQQTQQQAHAQASPDMASALPLPPLPTAPPPQPQTQPLFAQPPHTHDDDDDVPIDSDFNAFHYWRVEPQSLLQRCRADMPVAHDTTQPLQEQQLQQQQQQKWPSLPSNNNNNNNNNTTTADDAQASSRGTAVARATTTPGADANVATTSATRTSARSHAAAVDAGATLTDVASDVNNNSAGNKSARRGGRFFSFARVWPQSNSTTTNNSTSSDGSGSTTAASARQRAYMHPDYMMYQPLPLHASNNNNNTNTATTTTTNSQDNNNNNNNNSSSNSKTAAPSSWAFWKKQQQQQRESTSPSRADEHADDDDEADDDDDAVGKQPQQHATPSDGAVTATL